MTFILVLGAIIILSCAVSVYLLIKPADTPKQKTVKEQKRASKKATKKTTPKTEPVLGAKPLETTEMPEDPDVVLGLKTPQEALAQKPVPPKMTVEVPKVISLCIKAEAGHPYTGYELLQALLAAGLRFGKMQIFHRHEKKTGIGSVLFSLANMEQPGTFDLAKMGGFSCTGLTLFMQPMKMTDPTAAYELMIEAAGQLVEDLGGSIFNDRLQPFTKEMALVTHQQLSEFMKQKQSLDLFV